MLQVFYFSFIGALGVAIAYAVVFLKQIGLSPFQIGIISGVRPVLGFVSAPAWGAVADRYNIRRVLMLVSMVAWLAFFSGLYFIEAPARRDGCDADVKSADRGNVDGLANVTTAATTTSNGGVSGTIVDVGLHVAEPNSSAAETTYMCVSTA